MKRSPTDPELLRSRLAEAQGMTYWRSLEELAGEPAFRDMLQRELPEPPDHAGDGMSRRRFLTLMGASLALAGLAGCRPPGGKIMPYARNVPDGLVPGKPLFFATAMELGGFSTGLLVESHEGRPTKIEGNPSHPASLGGTSALHQAAILSLYDPDRSRSVSYRNKPHSWPDFLDKMRQRLRLRPQGEKVAVLVEPTNSPTFHWQKERFEAAYPQARWFTYTALNDDNAAAGSELAFGTRHHCYQKLDGADVIVALDCDFLAQGPAHLAHARQFAARRRNAGGTRGMNRLYAVETDVSVTGARADNRLAVKPSQVEAFARALAGEMKVPGANPAGEGELARWARVVADDLRRVKSAGVVMVGPGQPLVVHAIAHAINAQLGNVGQLVFYTLPLPGSISRSAANLAELCDAIDRDEIDTLFLLGGNPVYTAPGDLPLQKRLQEQLNPPEKSLRAETAKDPDKRWIAVHLGPYFDETARWCHWHVPEAHFLEAWGDGVAYDGTASITQPLIAPLYNGKSALELLAALTPAAAEGGSYDDREAVELVRGYWQFARSDSKPFETFWQESLHDGVLASSAAPTVTPTVDPALFAAPMTAVTGDELQLAADLAVYDGRFANNGWMQEWPRPLTRLTWDNAVLMSPATAERLGVKATVSEWTGGEHGRTNADKVTVELKAAGRPAVTVVAPVFLVPGHADNAFTLHLGYGRTHAGRVGTKVGVNAYPLASSASPFLLSGVKVSKARGRHALACTQAHHNMEGRDPVRAGTVAEYKQSPKFIHKHDHGEPVIDDEGRRVPLSLFESPYPYDGYKWGLGVDLSACTGCGACVVACQSENNSPVVGKEEVMRGREMHWLRIDYYRSTPKGDEHNYSMARHHFQPLMCQHCEKAPCEVVCPVAATAHGDEGTNDMVYNRCVGTKYCANNCPYKVRRFNFFAYSDFDTPSLRLMYNPDVTVRSRGVMEKCSFCIQRIAYARIEAEKEALDEQELPAEQRRRDDPNKRTFQGKAVAYIPDGEVMSACQSACPSEAIIFGDLNDKRSRVRRMHRAERADGTHLHLRYDLLGELGTRPRVAYLAELRNPNPALEAK